MVRLFVAGLFLLLNACTTEYILMEDTEVSSSEASVEFVENEDVYVDEEAYAEGNAFENEGRLITANDVFVVSEGQDFVTYQYKNIRVDEVSPLASMYCADVAFGGSPYLREVSLYHNGFMRATFDCVSLAI